jgi:hypothetical protein
MVLAVVVGRNGSVEMLTEVAVGVLVGIELRKHYQ